MLTLEQKAVVEALEEHEKIIVSAFAGTGKTSTIKAIAEAYPNLKFLVLAFNKSIQEELSQKLPSNCEVKTFHSLALHYFKRTFGKNRELSQKWDVVKKIEDIFYTDGREYALFLYDVIESYFNDYEIKLNNESLRKIINKNLELRKRFFILEATKKITFNKTLTDIQVLYQAFEEGKITTHSSYLKWFQMNLNFFTKEFERKYDVLLVDEAQDINGVQIYIIEHLPIRKKLIVGDKHQSIYSWRDARNSLSYFRKKDWKEFKLTYSFRFANKKVVDIANSFLSEFKKETHLINADFSKNTRRNGLKAFISRANSSLLKELIYINEPVRFTRSLNEIFRYPKEAHMVGLFFEEGDVSHLEKVSYHIKSLLTSTEEIKDLESLSQYLISIGDIEYANAALLAARYDIEMLEEKAYRLEDKNSKFVLSTAHSSKGLEFDKVLYAEDFPSFEDILSALFKKEQVETVEKAFEILNAIASGDENYSIIIDEMNLQYVAITRCIEEPISYMHLENNMLVDVDKDYIEDILNNIKHNDFYNKFLERLI